MFEVSLKRNGSFSPANLPATKEAGVLADVKKSHRRGRASQKRVQLIEAARILLEL
jgi:hypothetical protein